MFLQCDKVLRPIWCNVEKVVRCCQRDCCWWRTFTYSIHTFSLTWQFFLEAYISTNTFYKSMCVYIYTHIFMYIVYNLYGFSARLQEHTAPPTSDPPASTGYPIIWCQVAADARELVRKSLLAGSNSRTLEDLINWGGWPSFSTIFMGEIHLPKFEEGHYRLKNCNTSSEVLSSHLGLWSLLSDT